jgi:pimeloyl-ACP methyl ester carboxylesterase
VSDIGTTVGTARSADGTTIAYEVRGTGPVVVLVDPAGHYRANSPFAGLAPLLAADFTVVTYDRRGRGASTDTPPYAVAREVEDLTAVVEATAGATAGAAAAGDTAHAYGLSSGGLLILHAAAAGAPLGRLALFEPPLATEEDRSADAAFTARLEELVRSGRHREAVEFFLGSIVPPEMLAGMGPAIDAMTPIAPTLVHDGRLSEASSPATAARVRNPTLVIDSEGSTGELTGWAAALVGALPRGEHRSLAGRWHTVLDEDLAPVVREFLLRDG